MFTVFFIMIVDIFNIWNDEAEPVQQDPLGPAAKRAQVDQDQTHLSCDHILPIWRKGQCGDGFPKTPRAH